MTFSLSPLNFDKTSLAPHISEATITVHHEGHHAAYINNLNTLIARTEYENMTLRGIILKSEGAIFNNAAQIFNHDFYFDCITSNSTEPSDELKDALCEAFDTFDTFKTQFIDSAKNLFGSGWTWLVIDLDGKLKIENTFNADTPIRKHKFPLLTVDVWEHAYYLDYKNKRADYLEHFWQLINWKFVSDNLSYGSKNKKELNAVKFEDTHLSEYIDMIHSNEIAHS